ncbi:MAG: hypothetical protein EON58_18305, partial [Alphaproteobacteria bacterium]
TTLNQAKSRAQHAAAAVAEGAHWTIAATLSTLDVAALKVSEGASATEIANAFDRAASVLPIPPKLRIYTADGKLFGLSIGADVLEDISGTDSFEQLRNGTSSILGYQPGGGAGRFTVARRVDRDGAFLGALVAELPGEVLSRFAAPHVLGAGSTVSLIRGDGVVIARHPPLDQPLNLEGTPAWKELAKANQGSYLSEASPADGVSRVVGFQRETGLDYIAVASISKALAFGGLWYSIWVVSLLLAPFALVLLVGSFLTARLLRSAQASSQSLAKALDHNEQLFREIHHRVKNNLQSVTALLGVHAIPADVRSDLTQRIFAMSAVHEHIYKTSNFDDVRIKDYLHTLIENVRAGANPNITVVHDLEDVTVDTDAAGPLGLILNEVLSNCFKHAFSDGRAGKVSVSLKRVADNRVELSVEDNGVGFDQTIPAKGIGRKLVAGFAKRLDGEFAFT